MGKTKDNLILYIVLCFVGAFLEWAYGMYWSLCGQTPWSYPDSPMEYTSFEGIPLWGLGGLICITIYRAYSNRSWKILAWLVLPLALAAIWIAFYEFVIK
jgi:hypothetical protein